MLSPKWLLSLSNCHDLKVYFSISQVVCMMLEERSDIHNIQFDEVEHLAIRILLESFMLPFMAQLSKSLSTQQQKNPASHAGKVLKIANAFINTHSY